MLGGGTGGGPTITRGTQSHTYHSGGGGSWLAHGCVGQETVPAVDQVAAAPVPGDRE